MERDPEKAEHLRKARQRLAPVLYENGSADCKRMMRREGPPERPLTWRSLKAWGELLASEPAASGLAESLTAYAESWRRQLAWKMADTAPRDRPVLWMVRTRTAEEALYCNTNGEPIFSRQGTPYVHYGVWGTWSSLSIVTHWFDVPGCLP